MSTKKIFIIFGMVVAVITIPLIILYIAFPDMIGRFTGLVENTIVGMIGSLIVAVTLDFILRRRQEKAAERVAKTGLSQASQAINRMLSLFAQMVKTSSDGFVPSTLEELFGAKAQELITLHLSLEKPAPVTSKSPWKEYLSKETENIRESLSSVQQRYQAFLPESAFIALGTLENNVLLHILQQVASTSSSDARLGINRPVLNFSSNSLKPLVDEILSSVKALEREARKLNCNVVSRFPTSAFRMDIAPKLGEARYDGPPGPPIYIGSEPPKLS